VKAELWLTKADRCLKTAELALADADPDSACNRAYYAMFNAARAALIIAGQSKLAMAKTHSGLVAAFGLHIAKAEHVPVELGRLLAIDLIGGWPATMKVRPFRLKMPLHRLRALLSLSEPSQNGQRKGRVMAVTNRIPIDKSGK
jgi:HEPN domain